MSDIMENIERQRELAKRLLAIEPVDDIDPSDVLELANLVVGLGERTKQGGQMNVLITQPSGYRHLITNVIVIRPYTEGTWSRRSGVRILFEDEDGVTQLSTTYDTNETHIEILPWR